MNYSIIETVWGPVLFLVSRRGLVRLLLPDQSSANPREAARRLWPKANYVPNLLPRLQRRLKEFFTGQPVEFQTRLDLSGLSQFSEVVLRACHTIAFGETMTYGQLAELAGHPGAARAVGSVMASNPLPLIIPCHRVVASGGKLGGFSAPDGVATKQRLLDLEASALQTKLQPLRK